MIKLQSSQAVPSPYLSAVTCEIEIRLLHAGSTWWAFVANYFKSGDEFTVKTGL